MISLFLDTAASKMIIGIYKELEELYLSIEDSDNQLSSKLLPAIKKAFSNINLSVCDIDRIYVVNGPGSFTGIRIGCTVAKTIAWALKKEIIPISKLELIATTDVEGKNKLALIDARRNFVYAGLYDKDLNVIVEDCYTSLESILTKVGEDTVKVSPDSFTFETMIPKYNIPLIIEKHKNDLPINPHGLNPNYLKKTEAEEKHDSSCGK